MPNFCAKIEEHSVSNTTLTYYISVIAADGATYTMHINIDGSELSGNISSFNTAIKTAVENKLLSDYGVTVGPGNKIVLMGGGV